MRNFLIILNLAIFPIFASAYSVHYDAKLSALVITPAANDAKDFDLVVHVTNTSPWARLQQERRILVQQHAYAAINDNLDRMSFEELAMQAKAVLFDYNPDIQIHRSNISILERLNIGIQERLMAARAGAGGRQTSSISLSSQNIKSGQYRRSDGKIYIPLADALYDILPARNEAFSAINFQLLFRSGHWLSHKKQFFVFDATLGISTVPIFACRSLMQNRSQSRY